MSRLDLKDHGAQPYVVNIEDATIQNDNYRTALWTGKNLQLTLMSIPVGGEIGLEAHTELDQFLRIEEGRGRVQMGESEDNLRCGQEMGDDWVVLAPAGMPQHSANRR